MRFIESPSGCWTSTRRQGLCELLASTSANENIPVSGQITAPPTEGAGEYGLHSRSVIRRLPNTPSDPDRLGDVESSLQIVAEAGVRAPLSGRVAATAWSQRIVSNFNGSRPTTSADMGRSEPAGRRIRLRRVGEWTLHMGRSRRPFKREKRLGPMKGPAVLFRCPCA